MQTKTFSQGICHTCKKVVNISLAIREVEFATKGKKLVNTYICEDCGDLVGFPPFDSKDYTSC